MELVRYQEEEEKQELLPERTMEEKEESRWLERQEREEGRLEKEGRLEEE